jgi:hypothetical protein
MSIIFLFNFGIVQAFQTTAAIDYLAKFYGFFGGYVFGGASLLFVKKRYHEYKRLRDAYEAHFKTIVPQLYFFWENQSTN